MVVSSDIPAIRTWKACLSTQLLWASAAEKVSKKEQFGVQPKSDTRSTCHSVYEI